MGRSSPKRHKKYKEILAMFSAFLWLVLRLINSFTIVASAMAPDSRSDEGAMLIHCDRGATTKTGPFRRNPSGRWGLRAISSSRFVGDERASPSSSLLDLASQAPSAMVKLFMRRNTSSLAVFERSGQSISRLAISGLTRHPGVPTDAIGLQGPSRRSSVRALLRSIPDGVARGLDLLFQEIAESIFAAIPGLEYIFRYFAHRVPWRSANRQFLPACPGYSQ